MGVRLPLWVPDLCGPKNLGKISNEGALVATNQQGGAIPSTAPKLRITHCRV